MVAGHSSEKDHLVAKIFSIAGHGSPNTRQFDERFGGIAIDAIGDDVPDAVRCRPGR
jgi:hypothetical protein